MSPIPGILDAKSQRGHWLSFAFLLSDGKCHATGMCEFAGVAQDIQQALLQLHIISAGSTIPNPSATLSSSVLEFCVANGWMVSAEARRSAEMNVEDLQSERLHPAGFDFGDIVADIVDEHQQVFAGLVDSFGDLR